jgi:hypothetical protein
MMIGTAEAALNAPKSRCGLYPDYLAMQLVNDDELQLAHGRPMLGL